MQKRKNIPIIVVLWGYFFVALNALGLALLAWLALGERTSRKMQIGTWFKLFSM